MTTRDHELLLSKWEREQAVIGIMNEAEYQKLRNLLVDKYGEDGVQKVEAKITKERNDGSNEDR